ncbi:MAG TPA: FAD-dependent oxidoreductase [Syntrophomonadaceae bacterium]|nr:FAD-dependent oxidoreductase [Syntrophomonadaceae bacterium]
MRVVIVGSGAAGNQAAETLRQLDSEVDITIVGADQEPFYSACALPDYLAGWVPRKTLFLRCAGFYRQQNINILLDLPVEAILPHEQLVLAGKERLSYDRLILATGSRPIIPSIPGTSLPGNFVVKTVADIDRILRHNPRQAVVVGSGNIGVEIAEALQIKGCEVSIVELQEQIMPRSFDLYPACLIQSILESHHIRVYTQERAREVFGHGRVEGLISDHYTFACDTVIWAAGVKQNTELAAAAGLGIGALGGIKVDKYLQTSNEKIYACGDCVETFDMISGQPALSLLWTSARSQARVAAYNCLGRDVLYPGALNIISEEIFGTNCAAAGLRGEQSSPETGRIIEREEHNGYTRIVISDNALIGVQTVGTLDALGPIITFMKSRTSLEEIMRILSTGFLLEKMPWVAPLQTWLSGQANEQGRV